MVAPVITGARAFLPSRDTASPGEAAGWQGPLYRYDPIQDRAPAR
jgi:hypothetical protein